MRYDSSAPLQIEIGQQPLPNPAPLQDLPGEKDCRSYLREKITSRDLKVVPTPSYFAITFQPDKKLDCGAARKLLKKRE